ncbi:hypothetical protein MA16_Dca001330 [Dendrobium catenatum]|uniref:Uncharacterized protein n=1 Tax=Dendrobium catenatum TaxID=906689 RepID=A0A2I0WM37_9ASPA|nr:hypothetical protein MA16_Dca001330 [Dendrobium catenatum]
MLIFVPANYAFSGRFFGPVKSSYIPSFPVFQPTYYRQNCFGDRHGLVNLLVWFTYYRCRVWFNFAGYLNGGCNIFGFGDDVHTKHWNNFSPCSLLYNTHAGKSDLVWINDFCYAFSLNWYGWLRRKVFGAMNFISKVVSHVSGMAVWIFSVMF